MQVAGKKGRREELSYGGHCGKRACAWVCAEACPTRKAGNLHKHWFILILLVGVPPTDKKKRTELCNKSLKGWYHYRKNQKEQTKIPKG